MLYMIIDFWNKNRTAFAILKTMQIYYFILTLQIIIVFYLIILQDSNSGNIIFFTYFNR